MSSLFLGPKMAALLFLLAAVALSLNFEEHSKNVIDSAELTQTATRKRLSRSTGDQGQSKSPECVRLQEFYFRNRTRKFVAGGTRVPFHSPEFPLWMVGMHRKRNNGWSFCCGGAVIGRRWILTAAHCLVADPIDVEGPRGHQTCFALNDTQVPCFVDPKEVMFAYSTTQGSGREFGSKKIIPHPRYGVRKTQFIHDIALVELKSSIPEEKYVPICLSRGGKMDSPEKAWSLGWGTPTDGKPSTRYLKVTELEMTDKDECKATRDCPNFLCGRGVDGTPTTGDSGSPLTIRDHNARFVIGVLSNSDVFNRKGFPAAYTQVSAYVKWIKERTGGLYGTQFDD